MSEDDRLTVAVLRPDDGRAEATADYLRSLGATPVIDPMTTVDRTGATPRGDADYVVLTSTTGVDIVAEADWSPGGATVCAIGETTATALRDAGYTVDRVPDDYSSTGLVDALSQDIDGDRIEIARSAHGSTTLPDGLNDAGAYVHETVLYRLVKPAGAGDSTTRMAAGELDAILFTSSLTADHFFESAADRGVGDAVTTTLNGDDVVVGAIGTPTREAVADHGVTVDVVPETADIELLAAAVVETAAPTHHH